MKVHLAAGLVALIAAWGMPGPAEARDSLVLAIGGEPDEGYDPIMGWGEYGHPLFQSTLIRRDADLEPRPDLATAWTLSEDRQVWTITLREDARFSDGSALTAEDVAFTFNTAARSAGRRDLSVLHEARAIDARTVELVLDEPRITFIEHLFTLGIVPADTYGPGYARAPIGSGPYRLVAWTEGEQLIVEPNPHHHGEPPAFERLTFVFTGEDTRFAAAMAGEVDLVAVPAVLADSVPPGMERVSARTVDNRGLLFPTALPGGTSPAGHPIGNAVTADPAIRTAVNIGIDRAVLVEVALLGHGTPAYGPADGLPWSNPEAALPDGDVAAAVALLEDAGWVEGDDGIRAREGLRAAFPIVYPATDTSRQMLAVTLSELLLPLGIAATPTGRTWDEIGRLAHSEPVLFGWGSHSPIEVYNLYHGAGAGEGYFNAGYYANPTVDAHLDAAQAAPDLEASYALWQAAEWDGETGFGMRGDAVWAWLVNIDHVYFVNECLDPGALAIEPHGHGWPITASLADWRWICD